MKRKSRPLYCSYEFVTVNGMRANVLYEWINGFKVRPDLYFEQLCRPYLCVYVTLDRLCGLVVRVPGYRSRGPGSILSAIRFSEK
jgi:hypothetical protein